MTLKKTFSVRYPIAVYINPKNDVVIRQAGQYNITEDHWVVLQNGGQSQALTH